MTTFRQGRRAFLKIGVAALVVTALPRVAFAAPKTIKIGLVAPPTGPLAIFTEHFPWTLDQIKAFTGGRSTSAEPSIRSRSSCATASRIRTAPPRSPRASSCRTRSTSDDFRDARDRQSGRRPVRGLGVPCLSNDCPLEPYFFGRQGDPKRASTGPTTTSSAPVNLAEPITTRGTSCRPTRSSAHCGRTTMTATAFSKIFTGMAAKRGYKIVDPGRSTCRRATTAPRSRRSSRPARRSSPGVLPPPEFTAFERRGAAELPAEDRLDGEGDRVPCRDRAARGRARKGLSVEVWWSPTHPFKSGLTGQRRRSSPTPTRRRPASRRR